MNNLTYPVFLKPYSFTEAEKSKPKLPPPPKEPEKPKLVKKNWFEELILPLDHIDDLKINEKRKKKYQENLVIYEQEMVAYNQLVSKILNNTNIELFRRGERSNSLTVNKFPSILSRDVLKGRFEEFFGSILKSRLGEKIFDNLEFPNSSSRPYVPDFVYLNREKHLCIDIEIDEPYLLDSGEPIHCIGQDSMRDQHFLSNGWFVLRFAEEQIAKRPHDVVEYIISVISYILGQRDELYSLFTVERWDYAKASFYHKVDLRNKYLSSY